MSRFGIEDAIVVAVHLDHCIVRALFVLGALLLFPGLTAAQPAPAPSVCDETWFDLKPGGAQLSVQELSAICEASNAVELFAALQRACPAHAAAFNAARDQLCAAFPAVGATEHLDLVAKTYRAAGDPLSARLPKPGAGPESAQSPADRADPEALAAAGAVTIVAQGLGDFLMSRAEKELSAYAATALFERVCEKRRFGWFPKTCSLLKDTEDDGEPVGLGLLRRSITEDIEHLPANVLPSVFRRLSAGDKQKACLLDVGYAFAQGLRRTGTIGTLLEADLDISVPSGRPPHVKLRRYRIQALGVQCAGTWEKLASALQSARSVLTSYREALRTVSAESARQVAKQAADAQPENSYPDHDAVLQHWVQLFESLRAIQAGEAPKESSERAIRAGVEVLKTLLGDGKNTKELAELGDITTALAERDWIGVVAAIVSANPLGPYLLCKEPEGKKAGCEFDRKARATLRLVADLASADSSEGVTAALDRFAEPIGSWRRKYGHATLMVNGFVGLKVAYESVDEPDAPPGSTLAPVLALGLEGSVPLGSHGRLGLFLQALDVGNVSSVRIASEDSPTLLEVEAAPDLEASQLLAPGVFLNIAPWKAPFVLCAGVDWVPLLRTVEGVGKRSVWHAGAALAVDVPILELTR